MTKEALASLLALLQILSPAATIAAVRNPGTFVYAVAGDVDSLDPAYQYDGISYTVITQVYETLIFYKGESLTVFEPILATTVPSAANGLISRDGRTYTFPIRKGVRFHDGTLLTPEDVKYSLMRFCLQDRDGGPASLLLEPLLGLAATRKDGKADPELFKLLDFAIQADNDMVRITLKTPFAPVLSVLAGWGPIVSKKWAAANGDWDGTEATWLKHNNPGKKDPFFYDHANGTGPFMLKRWDKEIKQVVLDRFDGYWRGPAKLEHLIFKTVDEFGTRKLLLQAGDADAIFAERQFQPQLEDLPGVEVVDDLPLLETTNCFIFNFKINPVANLYVGSGKLDGQGIPPDFFADRDVRRGFAHAFDYDAYIRDGYRGKGTQARGPIPKGVLGHNEKQELYRRDPAKAAEHLKKAHGGRVWEQGFRFSIGFMQGRADRQLACQILKKTVEELNPKFQIDVRPIQWSTYLSLMQEHKLPMANARWGMDYPDPHNNVFPFLHSQGNYPVVQGYNNPEADKLVGLAVRELDPRWREQLYFKLQDVAYQDVPQIFTVDTVNLRAQRKWVKGLYYNPILPSGYFYKVSKEEP